jgi:hypothetical protein
MIDRAEQRPLGGEPLRRGANEARRGAPCRQAWLAVLAVLIAIGAVLAPATASTARAAEDGLLLTTNATYTVVPARRLVRVVVDVTARNNKPNVSSGGTLTRYFYEGARLGIQAEARNVRATAAGARLRTIVRPDDGFSVLEIRFRTGLFFRQSLAIRLTYDLPGGAPRSNSDIRVGTAFVTFVAWAFGDTGAVRVNVPAGFEAKTTGSDVTRSTNGGATVFRATRIADPTSWYLVVNAERAAALTREPVNLRDGERLVIRAWPEDAEWRSRVSELLTQGLPELVSRIGLDWPVASELSVFEVHTPLLEGYAGVFFVDEDKIEISEDLDDLTILHEASHAWFNGNLFEGRWINEGLADAYAADALASIGIGGWAPKRVDPGDDAAVRLETWTHPGRIADDETDAREQYGYEASWTVIRSLVAEIGEEPMRSVLAAARDREIPYAGSGTPETLVGPADWRRFLDLLEEVGGSRTADEAFRRWVVTDAQLGILDKRVAARATWAELVKSGGDWRAPMSVRDPLARWDFATATQRMAEATALLEQRDAIVAQAAALGVEPPTDLRTAYQTASTNLDVAEAIAERQLGDLEALRVATAAAGQPRDLVVSLGLIGRTPDVDLAGAKAAFTAGALDAAPRAAAVSAVLTGATEVGQGRLAVAIAIVLVLILLVVLAVFLVRRRRGRRSSGPPLLATAGATTAARATASADPDGPPAPPSGTLADQPLAAPEPRETPPAADPVVESSDPPPVPRSDAS